MAEHKFPSIYIGCPVEVWTDPSGTDVTLGYVRRAKTTFADIVAYTEGGVTHLYDCLFETDPRIQTMPPEEWQYARGIFRLSPGEVQRRELTERLDALETKLVELLSKLEPTTEAKEERPKRGRGPGRPRKPKPAEELEPVGV